MEPHRVEEFELDAPTAGYVLLEDEPTPQTSSNKRKWVIAIAAVAVVCVIAGAVIVAEKPEELTGSHHVSCISGLRGG